MKISILQRATMHTDFRKRWLYLTTSIASYRFDGIKIPNCDIYQKNKLLGSVIHNTLTIYKGYAFDGMTNFPDSSANLPCALLHDFLYQTALISRRDSDRALKACMEAQGASYDSVVFLGVRMFGWLHYGKEKGIRIDVL
jgi:hypothetical protein